MYYLDTDSPMISYEEIVNSSTYVDKSLFIKKINEAIRTDSKYICITRPRRFGKTTNAIMLCAYYTVGYDSRNLFEGLKIESIDTFEKHLNRHHVIYIDFSRLPDPCKTFDDYLDWVKFCLHSDMKEAFQVEPLRGEPIQDIFKKTKENFIFILDEWDFIFYENFMTIDNKIAYLQFLKGLLKDQPYVELAYMTGVLPIPKYSISSDLNMFREYNFMYDMIYQDYFGFQEDEVKELCKKYTKPTYDELKYWYDGYTLDNGRNLLNPLSVSSAFRHGECRGYWTNSGPMYEIADCIKNDLDAVREDIVKMISGQSINVKLHGYNTMNSQSNSRDEILSTMVVYGFLSYWDGILKIPNYELMVKFQQVLESESCRLV